MGLSILCCVLLQSQASALNWNPKAISLPEEIARIQFPVYTPSKKSSFNIQRALLVWVPKLEEFPGRPGRQALRLTMEDQDGRILEVFVTPSIKDGCEANISQIVGQGYLSFSLKVGMSKVVVQKQGTCIGLVSKDLSATRLHAIASDLQLMRPLAPQ